MGTNGQLFPLTDNIDDAVVDQVQQQHLLTSTFLKLNIYNIYEINFNK
jgi:hypothetical protein